MHNEYDTLTVSIINFRTPDMTIACAESVLADVGNYPVDVVIVDNFSDDGSVEILKTWLEQVESDVPVRLIESETNSGFSGGHNQSIRSAESDNYLLLNSDAAVRSGFFEAVFQSIKRHPEAGLIGMTILDGAGEEHASRFRFHTPTSELIRGARSDFLKRLFPNRVVVLSDKNVDEGWLSFACVLIRRAVVEQVGLLDEGFFLYFEDTEYCHRARRAGWSFAMARDAYVTHEGGGSGPVVALSAAGKRKPKYFYSSRTRLLYKMHGFFGLIACNLMWSFGRLIAQLRRLQGRPVPKANEMEWRDIWTNVLKPLGPRYAPWETER